LSQEVPNQYHTDQMKLSFVLFDEIEKASDALWNLLLGILDKGTLTLGDNRKVDFCRAMIFMTSNLGASEMASLMTPKLGFNVAESRDKIANGEVDSSMSGKLARSGVDAARRKFTPEFMNRLDKIVTLNPRALNSLKGVQVTWGPLFLGAASAKCKRSDPATRGLRIFPYHRLLGRSRTVS